MDESTDLNKFCAQQIQIPPQLPNILKQYTKAAIRTQPKCLLQWSAAYFRAMASGEVPPTKDRMEYPENEATSGLTMGMLRVLNKQLGPKEQVTKEETRQRWKSMCLDTAYLEELFAVGNLPDPFEWVFFVGLAAGTLGKTLTDTMKTVCEVLTSQPDGAEPYIEMKTWWRIYMFMVEVDGKIPMTQVEQVQEYLTTIVSGNQDMIGPRDFLHQDCPQLH
jgi:hypothetical protein